MEKKTAEAAYLNMTASAKQTIFENLLTLADMQENGEVTFHITLKYQGDDVIMSSFTQEKQI